MEGDEEEQARAGAAAYEANENDEEADDQQVVVDGDDSGGGSASSDNDDMSVESMRNEPQYENYNIIPFKILVTKLEALWRLTKGIIKQKKSKQEQLETLMPKAQIAKMEGHSAYPLIRLLDPKMDTKRKLMVKSKRIANMYSHALGLSKNNKLYNMLDKETDPQVMVAGGAPAVIAGDISRVVEFAIYQLSFSNYKEYYSGDMRKMPLGNTKITIGEINSLIDEIQDIFNPGGKHSASNHDWENNNNRGNNRISEASLTSKSGNWVRKLINRGFSPLQHKWMVRILIEDLNFGQSGRAILGHFSKYANELYDGHNNLKYVCDTICSPEFEAEKLAAEELRKAEEHGSTRRWEPPRDPAILQNLITPMLSSRTSFAGCLADAQKNHIEYLKTNPSEALTLKFPPLSIEVKLDGERIVSHVKDGIVTMNTRNGVWYSQLYGPVVAPFIRGALQNYPNLNVILDGEMLSWDNRKRRIVPFGNNRTVASYRRAYLKKTRQLDHRDIGLHDDDGEISGEVKRASEDDIVDEVKAEFGSSCWLKYVVFDLLYVDGEDATRLFQDVGLSQYHPGSIIHLSAMERKTLLYRLLTPLPNKVEFNQTLILRPDGTSVKDASIYFSTIDPMMEHGHSILKLDSTQATIAGDIPGLESIDKKRRDGKSDEEIDRLRSNALDDIYRIVVEEGKEEGILIKDLAAPYILGGASRSRRHWHKFKPDYESGEAVDIDVVIVGANFATGFKNSGRLSEFLCAVKDDEDPTVFLTFGYVNGNSLQYEDFRKVMDSTGFKNPKDGELDLGKWFQEREPGKSLPQFISSKTFQYAQEDGQGSQDGWQIKRCQWRAGKKSYPDLWIDPEDSVVVELRGAELISTTEYATGITLRFPRINKLRLDGDQKPLEDLYTDRDLFNDYHEAMAKREAAEQANSETIFHALHSSSATSSRKPSRFLTPGERQAQKAAKKRRGRKRKHEDAVVYEDPDEINSIALKGLTISVLEGTYKLDKDSIEAQEARDQGWFDQAIEVTAAKDVVNFVKMHGATFRSVANGDEDFLIGGTRNDAKVINTMRGINNARAKRVEGARLTKSQERINRLATQVGVLKWTFLYSVVHRWLKNDTNAKESMKAAKSYLLDPKADDYLACASTDEVSSAQLFDADKVGELSVTDLRRALLGVGAMKPSSESSVAVLPWQIAAMSLMEKENRWALSCHHQCLWPYSRNSASDDVSTGLTIIYPDLFLDDFGLSTPMDISLPDDSAEGRWKSASTNDAIESTLPLAKAMGALVTCNLHANVSLILCELPDGIQSLSFDGVMESGNSRAVELVSHAKRVGVELSRLQCVTPRWIRNQWQQGEKVEK